MSKFSCAPNAICHSPKNQKWNVKIVHPSAALNVVSGLMPRV